MWSPDSINSCNVQCHTRYHSPEITYFAKYKMTRLSCSIFAKEPNVGGQRRKLEKSDKGVNEAKIYEKEKRSQRFVATRQKEFSLGARLHMQRTIVES